MKLSELAIGQDAIITSVETKDVSLRKHILEMGLTPGVEVSLLKCAPLGDPIEIQLRGYNLTLRKSDAENINISGVHESDDPEDEEIVRRRINETIHPNLGEEQLLVHGSRRKAGTPLSLALVGNQNCGKTTLFNQLTGSNQHVGNFPGVTVDRKDGQIRGHKEVTVTDLPGIYSLAPYTSEEIVTRNFIIKNQIEFYREIEPLVREGLLYRLTSPKDDIYSWEYVSEDASHALVCAIVMKVEGYGEAEYVMPRGLTSGARYREIISGREYCADALMDSGLPLPVSCAPYASRMYRFERIDE